MDLLLKPLCYVPAQPVQRSSKLEQYIKQIELANAEIVKKHYMIHYDDTPNSWFTVNMENVRKSAKTHVHKKTYVGDPEEFYEVVVSSFAEKILSYESEYRHMVNGQLNQALNEISIGFSLINYIYENRESSLYSCRWFQTINSILDLFINTTSKGIMLFSEKSIIYQYYDEYYKAFVSLKDAFKSPI